MAESQRKEPPEANWFMFAFAVIAGIVLLGGVVTGFVYLAKSCHIGSQSNVALPPCETGIVCVNAYTVCKDYSRNEVDADQKYKDKTVRISGRIRDIGRDNLGRAYVELQSGVVNCVERCYFDSENEHLLVGFRDNDQIWIQGKGAGFEYVPETLYKRTLFKNCDMIQFLNPQQTQ